MIKMKSLTRERKFLLLALIPAYFIVAGLLLQPLEGILEGVYTMIREPDFLITDYIAVGGSLYQRRRPHFNEYRIYLFSRHGDGWAHHYVQLSDVWILTFWQKPDEYLGYPSGSSFIRQIP